MMMRSNARATAAALQALADAGITGTAYEADCDVWVAGRAVQAALGRGPKRQRCAGAVRYPDGSVLCPAHAKKLRRPPAVTGFGISPTRLRAPCPECGESTILWWAFPGEPTTIRREPPTRCTRCCAAEAEKLASEIAADQEVGPCARCRQPCRRYGPQGAPLCPSVRDARHPPPQVPLAAPLPALVDGTGWCHTDCVVESAAWGTVFAPALAATGTGA
jgi:hypothetical protein